MTRPSEALALQLQGYRLATAEITYHLPDHPSLLQIFIWQHYDLAPWFPKLRAFLDYWSDHIEGRLHSVMVGRAQLLTPARWHNGRGLYELH